MAVTRINTNQINDAQVTAAKIAPYTLTGGLFSNTITFNSNISVIGNLDVTGNTTTVNSVNTYINDPIITFNNGYTGAPSYDIGILVNRNLGSLTGYGNYNTAWIWDESAGSFTGVITTEVGNSSGGSINKSYYANLKVGNLTVVSSLATTTLTVGAGIQNTPIGNATPSTGAFTTGYFDNLSTGNAVITGGYISALANAVITNFSTGNAVITGGYLSGLANITATTGNVNTWYATNLNVTTGNITTGNIGTVNATTGNITTLLATNFSTANAVITGGYINSVANINATAGNITTGYFGSLNTANAVITGGYIQSVTNVYATTGTFTNFSTANAVITGGYINSVANINATAGNITTGYFGSLNTANAVITGGYINSVANINATAGNITTGYFGSLNTANAVITGGYINSVANINATVGNITTGNIVNFSTGNAVIGGGYISAMSNITATTGNVDSWYAGTLNATTANITTGNINNFSTANARISGGYADNFAIGANVAGPASFTTANTSGNLTVNANATVTNTLYAANIVTTGTSGNISGVDYLLTANIIATANAQASWFLGNVKGATGNLTTLNANLVTAGYFKSDNYQYANGNPFISTSIANTAEITANVSGGQNVGLLLTTTGVSAGAYGSSSSIPTIVVDAKGRVSSITTNSAATGFDLAADYSTGSISAGQIFTINGTANEIGTQVSSNVFTIGLPTEVNVSTLFVYDFSTPNAVLSGGYISSMANIYATTALLSNFSTANAYITGGYADNFPVGANTAATGAFTTLTASDLTTLTNSQASNGTASGALVVTGGVGIGGNLNIAQNAYIGGNLSVAGKLTYINSTVVTLLDPILELNTGANGVGLGTTTSNDVGIRAHYYDGADQAGFFGRVNATGNFEYFAKVTSETGNVITGTYGTIKSGNLIVANTTQSTAANTGAFQVYGGGSIVGNLYVGNIFALGGNIGVMSNVTSQLVNADSIVAGNTFTTNFSTGNAVITGGYIQTVANVYAGTAQFGNLSTANAVITGGYIQTVSNVYAGTAQFGNLSTANAVITGGYINSVANVYAGTAQFGNLSTANAVITGGYINSVANINATAGNITTLVAPNFSSANAVITGGYINAVSNINATDGNITTLVATNFSTGNAVLSGGYISAMSNITATTGNVNSWYAGNLNATTGNITTGYFGSLNTANAVITGGYLSGLANITATTGNVDSWYVGNLNVTNANITGTLFVGNFSTANAVLSGGYISSMANVYANTAQFGNLSSANAVFSGGYISSMSNITASTAQFGNLSSANAVFSGGYISSMSNITASTAQFGNLGSGNAYITGGTLNNTIIGNATPASGKFTVLNVTANVYLAPQDGAGTVTINPLNISSMDNMSIGASYSANAYVTNFKSTTSINAPTTGPIWLNAGTLSGSGINNIPIGAVTPATAVFTTANTTGNLTVGGSISVSGNIVPSANVIYSLGTSTNRFKDIWISGQTEYLGGAIIAEDTNGNLSLTTSGGNRLTLVNTAANTVIMTGNVVSPYFLGNIIGTIGNITTVTAASLQAQAIGNVTPGTGAFTTITANSTITANGNIIANSGTTSGNVSTGALVVVGGAGISGNVNLGGNLTIGGNINSASNIVINSNKSAATDFVMRGVNENSLIYAITNPVFDQVVIGGNITTANVTQGAKLVVSSTDSMRVPVGTTSDRPSGQGFTDVAGMLRFNTTTNQLEYYDGTQWIAPSTVLTIITSTQYASASGNPAGNVDGSNTDFTLPSAATTNSVIVSINGIVQLPTVAYSVINSGFTVRFTEAPAIGDVIDVRILTTTGSISQLQSANGLNVINIDNGNVTISTGNVSTGSIDRWHFDVKGDFIPQTTANIGNVDHRVNYLFASNINIQGGALSGVSIAGTSFDGIPIGGNIASSGAFTSLYATTFANVPTLNVNNSATIGSGLTLGSGIYVDDSTGYSVLDTTTGMVAKFDKTVYRSGKYFIQLTKTDNSEFQSAEVMVVHNGTTPTVEVYAVTYTGASALGSFTANISGNDVNINATALAGDVNAKVHPKLMKL